MEYLPDHLSIKTTKTHSGDGVKAVVENNGTKIYSVVRKNKKQAIKEAKRRANL